MNLDNLIKEALEETLSERGYKNILNESENKTAKKTEPLNEAYVAQAGSFDLQTELLSSKTKKQHQQLLEGYVNELNDISAKLDGVDKSAANLNNSQFRSLKIDEAHNHNAAFLHGLYFQNISDLNSTVAVDSLSYMRLSRDFGTFDKWQEDFIACCMSARNGWALTVYNPQLQRYMNTIIDLHSNNLMFNCVPIIVMDCWEHSYFRDYLADRKTYVFGMMKELNWDVIDERIKKADLIAKVLR